jgi:hypothetical protein
LKDEETLTVPARVFEVMEASPRRSYQLLTKRPWGQKWRPNPRWSFAGLPQAPPGISGTLRLFRLSRTLHDALREFTVAQYAPIWTGDALAGERRESLEIFTKVFGATGPGGPNDSGLSRKHIHESINASLTRLQTDYIDLYQAHRYDFSTPLEETMEAFADVVRLGRRSTSGSASGRPQQLRAGHKLARELKISFVSNQSKYNALYRVIEPEVVQPARSWV